MRSVFPAVDAAGSASSVNAIREPYLRALTLVERSHRRLLDVIKEEFDRRGRTDINPVQALIVYNIGDQQLCAGELRTRGYYLGTNVTYNLKKLVEIGLLEQQRSRIDRRSVHIKLTPKGREVCEIVEALCLKHAQWSRLVASMPMNSLRSTSCFIGWNASGSIRLSIKCKTTMPLWRCKLRSTRGVAAFLSSSASQAAISGYSIALFPRGTIASQHRRHSSP